jgi:VIT1/CCC1 family predicted Fe2+/Mn2+ transporter
MIPYFALKRVKDALFVSIGITIIVLLVFGYVKARFVTVSKRIAVSSAFHTLLIGALAAGASYGIVRALDTNHQGVQRFHR